ncbi:hypothetical protein LCGC14_3103230 [marine sediment metagenome]|uniref:Uncharacterized protein n=1 Tax=marine sediment metagenome TaxID=412755 RepID=A0A0F8W7J0_9ZZZZ
MTSRYGYGDGLDCCLIRIEHEKGIFYMSVESGDLSWVYTVVLNMLKRWDMAPPRLMKSLKLYSEGGPNTLTLAKAQGRPYFELPGSDDEWVCLAARGWWVAADRLALFEAHEVAINAFQEGAPEMNL